MSSLEGPFSYQNLRMNTDKFNKNDILKGSNKRYLKYRYIDNINT